MSIGQGVRVNSSAFSKARRYRIKAAISRWVGFQARMVFWYTFAVMFLSMMIYAVEEILIFLWAIWAHYSAQLPLVPM
jgi:hypothetical protein